MDKIKIISGKRLEGKIYISGAKNAALPLICASLLTDETVTLTNMPMLSDIKAMNVLLEQLGTKIDAFDDFVDGHPTKTYSYRTKEATSLVAPYDYVRKMRASYYVLGPLLARYGKCELSLPGGCAIGARPMDIHLSSLEQMGAHIEIKNGYIHATVDKRLKGAHIIFPMVSVGATCNVLMAATLAEGRTVLENAAKEPHVVDVANFLNSMGANIKGAGTDVIRIKGVEKLHRTEYSIIPDQIEAGTFMFAAAATGGDVTVKNVIPKHLEATTAKLEEIGCEVEEFDDAVRVRAGKRLHRTHVKTLPYPGYPTDMQPQIAVTLALAEGTSIVTESIFENRFKYADELSRMGACIKVEGNSAIIDGVKKLTGARVSAPDLRAGAALVIAGLAADGITVVDDIVYIQRGYENFEEKLRSLGAEIEKVSSEKEIQKFRLRVG